MERKTYIVTVDEKSSCVGVMPAFGNSRYDKVTITKPVSVTALDGFPTLCRAEALEKERQEGQDEAWELAQKILALPSKGGYTPEEINEIFGDGYGPFLHDLISAHSYQEVATHVQKWEEKQAKKIRIGDVVKLHWGGDDHLAVVTWTKPGSELLSIVLDDGNVGDIVKNQCTKTGKTLGIAAMLVELNGEEE